MPEREKLRRALQQEALRLLVRREHSRQELQQKLTQRLRAMVEAQGLDTEAFDGLVQLILDELGTQRFQSDQRFAQQRAGQRGARYGNQRIKHELAQRGIDDQTISDALAAGENEFVRCRSVWQKKFGALAGKQEKTPREEIAKQVRFLQYRGFSGATIRQVMKSSSDSDFEEPFLDES